MPLDNLYADTTDKQKMKTSQKILLLIYCLISN